MWLLQWIEWLVVGDFNEITTPSEKKEGGPMDLSRCESFASWINECNLLDQGSLDLNSLGEALNGKEWIEYSKGQIVLYVTYPGEQGLRK